ncbi:hypothetical protein [Piscirickettsia salmonis]|uniref:hypothetical protein n=1 Tax=Piscirickettsia salmonis TaxID=1238 RepID=UPI001013D4B0|nr:hypothetical protein [Piscirickettsia salmonis]
METTHKNIEYEKIFNILNRFTKNKEVIIESINKNALPKIGVKKSFLDIGAGPGKLLKKFSPIFKYSLAIEPKENYFNQLKKKAMKFYSQNFKMRI